MRKAKPTVQAWQSDKESPEKSAFDFFGDFVLTEDLGGGAGQCESGSGRLAQENTSTGFVPSKLENQRLRVLISWIRTLKT
ncbi:hypothetical protein RKD52_003657 [Metabacillus sp. SLBN-84]